MKLIFLSLLFIKLSFCQMAYSEELLLQIGGAHTIENPQMKTIYQSNKKLLGVTEIEGRKILVRAKALGKAEIRIGSKTYFFHVLSKAIFERKKHLQKILDTIYGLNVGIEKPCLAIHGKLLKISDWEKLANQTYGKKLANCPLPYLMKAKISEDISLDELNNILLEAHQDKLKILRKKDGAADLIYSEGQEKLATSFSQKLGIQARLHSEKQENSQYAFELIAVKDSEMKNIGIGLPNTANFNMDSGWDTENLNASISALYNQGNYTHLQSIQLSTYGDQAASFHSGGEIPIKLLGERSSKISWKAYGFLLQVKTLETGWNSKKISLNITASNLDSANSIEGIPSIQKQEYKGNFLVRDRLEVLFSFKNLGETESSTGTFGIHLIPFIKEIFSSKQIRLENHHLLLIHKPIRRD